MDGTMTISATFFDCAQTRLELPLVASWSSHTRLAQDEGLRENNVPVDKSGELASRLRRSAFEVDWCDFRGTGSPRLGGAGHRAG